MLVMYVNSPVCAFELELVPGGCTVAAHCSSVMDYMQRTMLYCTYVTIKNLVSLAVYLHHATQSYLQDHTCNPARLTVAMVVITPAPAWRPMPLSALTQESVSTGGTQPMGSVVRYIVNSVQYSICCVEF